MRAGHGPCHVDGESDCKPPGNTYTPVGLAVRAGVIERVHRGGRITQSEDDERGHALGEELDDTGSCGACLILTAHVFSPAIVSFVFQPAAHSAWAAGAMPV